MRLILIGYRDRAVGDYRTNSVKFSFLGVGWKQNLLKKGEYTRRITRSHFGC